MSIRKKLAVGFLLLVFLTVTAVGQESLNSYYRYPVSIGAGYHPLSPIGDVLRRATVNDISGRVRVPLPFMPALQPFALGGLVTFDSDEADDPTILGGVLDADAVMPDYDERDTWDHRNIFGGLGIGYAHRMTKEFEIGAEVYGGLSQSFYQQRVVTAAGAWYPVGELGLIVGVNGKISLNPSFNLSIDVVPSFRYDRSFGNLPDFDGLYFGLGFAAHYRFGQDPDAPQADVRALQFTLEEMPPVFAAMQKVYVDRPISYVTLLNAEADEVTDLVVEFYQAGYMDSPTLCAEIQSIPAGESIDVPIKASFSEAVFNTVDVIPLNGEIIATYFYRGNPVDQRRSVTFNLQDRNSLTWDDDRKVAAFITPKDSAVLNYASFVSESAGEENTDYLPDALEFAMQAYHALAALEIGYQSDPSSPFEEVQGNPVFIDSVSLPRETLKRGTGDCDDITVLFNTMLESVGVPSGIITIPGHIYSAVNTGFAPRDYARVHPDRDMTLVADETLWVLVEITLIGRAGFMDAWQTGMQQWHTYDNNEAVRNFYSTASCRLEYGPVGLQETDIGLQYGDPEEFLAGFRQDLNRLSDTILAPIRDEASRRNRPRTWNHTGVLAAQLKNYAVADDAFARAAQMDADYLSPRVNLGALRYLQGDYDGALSAFESAEAIVSLGGATDETALAVYVNLAKTLHALGSYDEAADYLAMARGINPAEAARYSYVASADASGGRASSAADGPAILFVDEGEE